MTNATTLYGMSLDPFRRNGIQTEAKAAAEPSPMPLSLGRSQFSLQWTPLESKQIIKIEINHPKYALRNRK